ncbi:hypothetical protein SMB34_11105 [Thalassospira permensis NBRC 106175]|uniref:Uncharacterized protein n=1 Tax=Thalassospira permensis NBRC 106175 TaxID=1353532 RepID=A0ABR4TT64_9PROT|nr:hypothetical protein SMB34_11105 [Thalassospira permensis NBRC 106175]
MLFARRSSAFDGQGASPKFAKKKTAPFRGPFPVRNLWKSTGRFA